MLSGTKNASGRVQTRSDMFTYTISIVVWRAGNILNVDCVAVYTHWLGPSDHELAHTHTLTHTRAHGRETVPSFCLQNQVNAIALSMVRLFEWEMLTSHLYCRLPHLPLFCFDVEYRVVKRTMLTGTWNYSCWEKLRLQNRWTAPKIQWSSTTQTQL